MYQGNTLSLQPQENGWVELCFNASKSSVNKFDPATIAELAKALDVLEKSAHIKGLLITSSKPAFIVGADIMALNEMFTLPAERARQTMYTNNENFNRLEDMPFPTVAAINGFALGGGFECCLACDYRVMSDSAQVGFPEAQLGLIPGWGGTVRAPRVLGLEKALEWITSGAHQTADKALQAGAVDQVVTSETLRDSAVKLLERVISGNEDYSARRTLKKSPLKQNVLKSWLVGFVAKRKVREKVGNHYPAPVKAVDAVVKAASLAREPALQVESQVFIALAQTPESRALVGLFLNDQYLNKRAKTLAEQAAKPIAQAAVLGAGIMGGGIAYQNAVKGIPIIMKDIRQDALDLGLSEAKKLLNKQVKRGRLTAEKSAQILDNITPTLDYSSIGQADVVVEAVVENPGVKTAVLREVEKLAGPEAILASNTSTISISRLAEVLNRPGQFCGLHFFNPVHAMKLVEVIRGEKTTDKTIAAMMAYALALGKKPVVVNDCPGFLMNRVLFPYFAGFEMLVRDGADFHRVDRVMEEWGWPMGPAYLLDVVGIDTAVHAAGVMAQGFPERMQPDYKPATQVLFDNNRLGQKNGKGFYRYMPDKQGKPAKQPDSHVKALLAEVVAKPQKFSDEEIVARMMVPMCTEIARCLEEQIVASPAEADMALIYGFGFPPFRGGVFRWLDEIGLPAFCKMAEPYSHLGQLYRPTEAMLRMVREGQRYYQ